MTARLRQFADQFICWLVIVFLLAGPHIANTLKDLTRYLHMWSRLDAVLMLGSLALVAGAMALAGCLAVRRPQGLPHRVWSHLLLLGLGAGLLTNLCFHLQRREGFHLEPGSVEMQTGWLMLFAITGYSFALPTTRLPLRARQFCQIVSPAVVIVAVQLLRASTYASPLDAIALDAPSHSAKSALSPGAPATRLELCRRFVANPVAGAPGSDGAAAMPVFVFVFDEWSYHRTFENGRPRSEFANLNALVQHSTTYTDAHSPGEDTSISMPRLLYQTDRQITIGNGRVGFGEGKQFQESTRNTSIFAQAAERQYRTFMVGFFLPYRIWLGPQVDVCRAYRWYPHGDSLTGAVAQHTFDAMAHWTDPWSMHGYVKIKAAVKDRAVLRIHESLQRDVGELIELPTSGTFAVVHYPLPHEPYILNEDGTYRGASNAQWVRADVEGYTRNLRLLDRLIGEWISALKAHGKYEAALLVFTSDHTWRFDPARPSDSIDVDSRTHVPLIVKVPFQQDPVVVDSRFENRQLMGLLLSAMDQNAAPPATPDSLANAR